MANPSRPSAWVRSATSHSIFFASGSGAPYALGTAFLLSTSYTGAAAALSSGTAGYLGQATAAGGFYSFGSGVTLTAGTQYFLYTNALIPDGAISGNPSNPYGGGDMLVSLSGNFFAYSGVDAGFRVTGGAVGAPDGGSTALMLALGAVGLWVGRRSRRA